MMTKKIIITVAVVIALLVAGNWFYATQNAKHPLNDEQLLDER